MEPAAAVAQSASSSSDRTNAQRLNMTGYRLGKQGIAMNALMLALTTGLAVSLSPALAQPDQPQLTSEQRDLIYKHILQEARPATIVAADLSPEVGGRIPENVELFWMPHSTGLNRYRYAVVNQKAIVVDHQDRRVVEVLGEASSRP
jgi:hypothetical protein